uniref:Uncharacterized protein n=1 Tax=Arundo donax TaxID=35708 RepID=A0A0A8Y8D6_ARUDO
MPTMESSSQSIPTAPKARRGPSMHI